jgi:hypothetical protein
MAFYAFALVLLPTLAMAAVEPVLAGLMRFQWSAFTQVAELPLITEGGERPARE